MTAAASPRVSALLAVAVLALSSPCTAQEFDLLAVTMKPFEVLGQADPEFARSLSSQIMRAIERNSDFRVAPGGPTPYYIKGEVLTDDKRHFVTLRLFEGRTDRMLWLENYDYRGVSADLMAEDVVEALYEAVASNTWK